MPGRAPLLLLVEDSEDDAYFFRRTVEKSGIDCTLHHAWDGSNAVEFLRKAAMAEGLPRAIFLDLKMPVLNGFEVLEWMQTQNFPSTMQVIVLSGSDHENDKTRAARLGASTYVVKPLNVADLRRFLPDLCPPGSGAPA